MVSTDGEVPTPDDLFCWDEASGECLGPATPEHVDAYRGRGETTIRVGPDGHVTTSDAYSYEVWVGPIAAA